MEFTNFDNCKCMFVHLYMIRNKFIIKFTPLPHTHTQTSIHSLTHTLTLFPFLNHALTALEYLKEQKKTIANNQMDLLDMLF